MKKLLEKNEFWFLLGLYAGMYVLHDYFSLQVLNGFTVIFCLGITTSLLIKIYRD